jgi:hypothetical protein
MTRNVFVRKNEKTKLFANFFEHKTNELKNDVFFINWNSFDTFALNLVNFPLKQQFSTWGMRTPGGMRAALGVHK